MSRKRRHPALRDRREKGIIQRKARQPILAAYADRKITGQY